METINLSDYENLIVNKANSNYVCPRCEKDSGYHIAKAVRDLAETDDGTFLCDMCADEEGL
jgi:ribosomal protein L37AE/L43A